MVELLRHWARQRPDERAFVLLSDHAREEASLTFAEFERRADAVAHQLRGRCRPGERALLLFPQSIDFLVALFGCLIAGVIAVPMMVPRRQSARDSSGAILADCAPRLALTNSATLQARSDLIERFRSSAVEWLEVDQIKCSEAKSAQASRQPTADDIAILQYTSGSTSEPKGTIVTHGNLLANSEMIRASHGNTSLSTYVSWVPLYHDMGLILNALQSFYVGALCVLLAPVTFMQRPLIWLKAIHDYRAEVAGGPNFGFDLCVNRFRPELMQGIDLSCWKLALNGAEPVQAKTIERFSATFAPFGFNPAAMFPAYGMAEATVLISGGRRGAGPTIVNVDRKALQRGQAFAASPGTESQPVVGCGKNLPGEQIAIVDPDSRQRRSTNRVGEIWVQGGNVARGYWDKTEETGDAFHARIDGEDGAQWLRTGDLGFLDETGELFITGRIKDVIIIRGRNHYPQDIESTVQASHPALRPNYGAAFGTVDAQSEERLIIVQEVERTQRNRCSVDELEGCIREAVVEQHEIAPHRIVLIRPGQIPKTTSGKIQRSLTRRLWLDGAFKPLT